MSFVKNIGKSIEENPIAWLFGIGAAGVGVWFLSKKLKGLGRGALDTLRIISDEGTLKAQGQTLSYPLTTYNNFANGIYEAAGVFNDEENTIGYTISKLKNDLDFVQLYKAFGKKRPPYGWNEVDLGGFITAIFNSKEIDILNQILQKNGLKSRF